jgi:hypothetical protein
MGSTESPSEANEWLVNAPVAQHADPEPLDADDFRESVVMAHRARRSTDEWSDQLADRIARLERRMAAFANRSQGVDSRARNPRKESS